MSLLALSGTNSVTSEYDIDNSLKFERANSEQIYTSNAAAGNRKTWTFSAWIKRTQLSQDYSTVFSCGYSNIQFMSNDRPRLILYNGSSEVYADPEMLMRDTASWYHIVVQVDSTQSTAADRVKWWINGDRVTDFNKSTYTNMSQNEDFDFGQAGSGSDNYLRLGEFFGGSEGFSGYMADVYYLNGTAAQASDFGEYDNDSGIWIPKAYTGSGYGTQGFYYKFDNASNLGEDSSGEGHDANNLSNITSADQATDTPTNNFCTMNPLDKTNGNIKTQEGATKVTTDGGSGWCSMVATMGVTKGKWYWEAQRMSTGTPNDVITGIVGSEDAYVPYSSAANYYIGNVATSSSIGYYQKNYPSQEGSVVNGVSLNFYSQGGDTIMFGLDMDNEKMYFGLNGTWKGTGDSIGGNTAGASALHADFDGEFVLPAVSVFQGNNMTINFGGYAAYTISSAASDADGYGTFEYAPPTGFYALCSQNLALYG